VSITGYTIPGCVAGRIGKITQSRDLFFQRLLSGQIGSSFSASGQERNQRVEKLLTQMSFTHRTCFLYEELHR